MDSISYQLAHLHDDRGPQLLQIVIPLLVLATASVGLRLFSRRLLKTSWEADDYAIVAALIFYWGISIVGLIAYHYGFGRHALAIGVPKVIINVKLLFAYEVLCTMCIYLIKLSILLFYRRIFPTPRFRRIVIIATIIMGFIYLAFFVTFFAQCIPLNYLWDRSIKDGACIDVVLLMRITAIINMATDIVILLMPMPVIWRLPQLSRGQKLGISAMFCLGGFVCVASVIRIFVLAQVSELDPTWSDFNGAAWTYAETCMGIFSACLPMMRPLFTTFLWRRIRNTVSDKRSTGGNKGGKSEDSHGTWPREDHPTTSGESTIVNSEDSPVSWPRIIVTSPDGSEEKTGELKRWRSAGHGDKIGGLKGTKRDMKTRDCPRVRSSMPLHAVHVQEVVEWIDCEKGEYRHTPVTDNPSEVERPLESYNRESRGPEWPLPNQVIIGQEDTSDEVEAGDNNVTRWRSSSSTTTTTTTRYLKTVEVAPLEKPHHERWITRCSYDPVQNLLPLNATDVQKMVEWAEGGKGRSQLK